MKKALLAAAVVLAASHLASAGTLLLPNGEFNNAPPNTGFTQTISNWTVSMSGTPNAALPLTEQSGVFTSFGKFTVAPGPAQFVLLANLGGSGVVSITSGASGTNFLVSDRLIGFSYSYLTNDAPGAFQHDKFRVHVDFFGTATSTIVTGTLDQDIASTAGFSDTAAGISPFAGAANSAPITYNNSVGGAFNFDSIDVSAFFNSFARISFIVDASGPSSGANLSGLGVSGVVLDQVFLTPEPSAIALFAFGAAGLGGFAWRRRRAAKKPAAA